MVALVGLLTPPNNHIWLALLVLWVAAYNVPTTLALNRVDNDSIRMVVRVAAIIDAVSYFVLLGIYAPSTPAVLIALFPCVLIGVVTTALSVVFTASQFLWPAWRVCKSYREDFRG